MFHEQISAVSRDSFGKWNAGGWVVGAVGWNIYANNERRRRLAWPFCDAIHTQGSSTDKSLRELLQPCQDDGKSNGRRDNCNFIS